jgi:hypothetical protein
MKPPQKNSIRVPVFANIALSVCFCSLFAEASAREWRIVASTEMIAPGDFGDRQFREFNPGDIDDQGNVIFGAGVITGAGGQASGIWISDHTGLALLARNLSFAHGVPGVRYGSVEVSSGEGTVFGANGNLLFKAVLGNGIGISDANRRGIWFGVPNSNLAPLVRIGQQAPGTPAGAIFGEYIDEVAMNESSQFVFSSDLVVGGGGVTENNRRGIWSYQSGTLQLITREGEAAPGAIGRSFARTPAAAGFGALALADSGDVAFVGRLDDERRGIWLGPQSDIRPVMIEGTSAPGVEPGAVFNILSNNDAYPDYSISPNGNVAFSFRLRNGIAGVSDANGHVLWTGRPGQLQVVARKGTAAPGMQDGIVFGFEGNDENPFRFTALNDQGQIAFGGYVKGPDVTTETNSGLWFGEVGNLQLIAREGEAAPGAAAGVVFGDLWRASPQLNATGQLVFSANVRGPGIASESNNSLWAFDEIGGLQLLGYETQKVAIGSPFVREIERIGAFGGGRASDGGREGLTDTGLLLASIRFRDGVGSIVTLDLNQPAGENPALLTFVAAGASWKYRDDGADLGVAWRGRNFDDTSWSEGPSELGYGDDDEVTVVNCGPTFPDCNADNHATTYFRRVFDLRDFEVNDLQRVVGLTASLIQDDAAAVYLNGVEVFRSGRLSPTAAFDEFADSAGSDDEINEFAIDPELLMIGTNVLAVEMHQAAATSSDVSFNLELTALVEPVPEPSAQLLAISLAAATACGWRWRRRRYSRRCSDRNQTMNDRR